MKTSKEKIKKVIKEYIEDFLNESDFDMEKMGRRSIGQSKSRVASKDVNRVEMVFSKYREIYPRILTYDDIGFIDFIINTGKLIYSDDRELLLTKKESLIKSSDRNKANDGTATRIGRMMFEGEESD